MTQFSQHDIALDFALDNSFWGAFCMYVDGILLQCSISWVWSSKFIRVSYSFQRNWKYIAFFLHWPIVSEDFQWKITNFKFYKWCFFLSISRVLSFKFYKIRQNEVPNLYLKIISRNKCSNNKITGYIWDWVISRYHSFKSKLQNLNPHLFPWNENKLSHVIMMIHVILKHL